MSNVYSFLDTEVAITGPGGSFTIGGTGTGSAEEGITIEMNEDKSTLTIGADGTPMHSLHAGQGGRLSIRLLKTSPLNAKLSAMYAVQTVSSLLHGQNVISLKNAALGDSITCESCAFKRQPTLTYAKEGGMNVWEFDIGKVNTSLGGGGAESNIVNALVNNLPTGSV